MAMRRFTVLIVGLKAEDAGKTTLARALLRYLREGGVDACGFKPKAGNNVWYDFDVVYESLSQGRLYGKDAKLLREASETELPEEVINPIHRLWAECYPSLEIPDFIADRITIHRRIIIVLNALMPVEPEVEELLERLCRRASQTFKVARLKELNALAAKYESAMESAYKEIAKRHEAIVVESYCDVALPWKKLKPDLVLGVEPWRISAYDAEKYVAAVELVGSTEVSTDNVCPLLKPVKQAKVPPSPTSKVVECLKGVLRLFF
ncbi:hypothetical protein [Candidatus Alkanophaga liquidiphilum]|nr:putative P-loop ATPase/GTPase [Candidatus Alkanophaga liquidiphilum]RLG36976.1 MAG: hypothetical protein DRN91_06600 [Candidatus Alkanophagales archaeon]